MNHVFACAGNQLIVVGIIHQNRIARSLVREELLGFGIPTRLLFGFPLFINIVNRGIAFRQVSHRSLGTLDILRVSRLFGKLVHKSLIVVLPQLIQVFAANPMECRRKIAILFTQEILELGFSGIQLCQHLGNNIDLILITPSPQRDHAVVKQVIHKLVQMRTQNEETLFGRGVGFQTGFVRDLLPDIQLGMFEKRIINIQYHVQDHITHNREEKAWTPLYVR